MDWSKARRARFGRETCTGARNRRARCPCLIAVWINRGQHLPRKGTTSLDTGVTEQRSRDAAGWRSACSSATQNEGRPDHPPADGCGIRMSTRGATPDPVTWDSNRGPQAPFPNPPGSLSKKRTEPLRYQTFDCGHWGCSRPAVHEGLARDLQRRVDREPRGGFAMTASRSPARHCAKTAPRGESEKQTGGVHDV